MDMQDETEGNDSPESPSENEMPSVFLSKAQLGGKTVKPGDTITFKILDRDPESGDAEAVCTDAGKDENDQSDYESAFDKAIPPDE